MTSRQLAAVLRSHAGESGHHAIDEWLAGRISRRALLRYAGVVGFLGMALAELSTLSQASAQTIGVDSNADPATSRATTIRVAHLTPAGAIDPLTISDPASVGVLNQTGEYLINDDGEALMLRPSLAVSWQPNRRGDVWTFKLRPDVRFHDGQPFGAADVVASFDRLTDPASGSAALSVFRGVLSKGGTHALDDRTVAFHLDAPNGNFPYYVSSDTYNAVILPANYAGNFEKSFPGTGAFRLESYYPKVGASFVRNTDYWGIKALPERVRFAFYSDQQSQILALQGDRADVMGNFVVQGGIGLLNNPRFAVAAVKSSSHRQMHMHCNAGPFRDKRVRQALALALDRDVLARGLFRGHATMGNDSPFAPVFPSSSTSLPQRQIDLGAARQLLAQAGVPRGFPVTLTTERFEEIPDYAVLVQNAAKAIGIDITLRIESQGAYYGSGTFGRSDWLDAPLGITDYGHRGVPNVFLDAPFKSNGAWNAARFADPAYDQLLERYVAALELGDQQRYATQIGALLLDQTPVIIPYFFDALVATKATVRGVRFTALSQLYLDQASVA